MLRVGDRGLNFSHDLIARAIYTDISPLRRQVMHRRVAELLEQDTAQDLARAADLAHHATPERRPRPGGACAGQLRAGCACASSPTTRRCRWRDAACSWSSRCATPSASASRSTCTTSCSRPARWTRPRRTSTPRWPRRRSTTAHWRMPGSATTWRPTCAGHSGTGSAAREQTLQADACRARRARRGADRRPGRDGQVPGDDRARHPAGRRDADGGRPAGRAAAASVHHAIAAGLGMLRFHENRLDEAASCSARPARCASRPVTASPNTRPTSTW